MKLISQKKGYDPDLMTTYISREFEHDGHEVLVSTDRWGHNIKVDDDIHKTAIGLSDDGLIAFIFRMFGRR